MLLRVVEPAASLVAPIAVASRVNSPVVASPVGSLQPAGQMDILVFSTGVDALVQALVAL